MVCRAANRSAYFWGITNSAAPIGRSSRGRPRHLGGPRPGGSGGFAPFIAAAHPSLLELESFTELERSPDLHRVFEQLEYLKWRRFRDSEDSRFVALTLPRVVPLALPGRWHWRGRVRFSRGSRGTRPTAVFMGQRRLRFRCRASAGLYRQRLVGEHSGRPTGPGRRRARWRSGDGVTRHWFGRTARASW